MALQETLENHELPNIETECKANGAKRVWHFINLRGTVRNQAVTGKCHGQEMTILCGDVLTNTSSNTQCFKRQWKLCLHARQLLLNN